MRTTLRWGKWCTLLAALGTVSCLLLCGPGLAEQPAAGTAPAPAAAAQLPEGQPWAIPIVLPWDDQEAQGGDWSRALNAKQDMTRRGKAGETHWYEFRRENVNYSRIGKPLSRLVAQGRLKRTLLQEEQPGQWRERVEWDRFAVVNTQSGTEVPEPKELPTAAGIGFDFVPTQFDFVNIPADFSRVGDEMGGYLLKIVSIDTMGFDALALAIRGEFHGAARIGDLARVPRGQVNMSIKKVTQEGEATDYRLGELVVSVAGITRRNGEPCLLLWFSADGNDVKQDLGNPQMTIRMSATEYFRGEMVVSLLDGRIVAGELFGPLPSLIEIGMGGEPPKEVPIFGVIQQVSLWEVAAPE